MASSIAYFSSAVAFSPMPKSCSVLKQKHPSVPFHHQPHSLSTRSPTTPPRFSLQNGRKTRTQFSPMAASSSSIGNAEYSEEPATSVKFPNSISLSDCSSSLSLLGTGYREKVFAIIGVKVYAAGLYVNPSMLKDLRLWKGKSSNEVENDSVLFRSIYESALEKSLQIILVRDVDGKTFWDALDEAVSPRVKAPTPVDDSALSTFRNIFQGRSLKKGTLILLTWLEPSKMLVSVSSNGLPTKSDATIESLSVTRALFDVFFGESPVSPTLKGSVAGGLASAL